MRMPWCTSVPGCVPKTREVGSLFPRFVQEPGVFHGLPELVETVLRGTEKELLPTSARSQLAARPGALGDQGSGGVVPEVDAFLDVAVERALGDVAQVQGAGPEATDVPHLRQQPADGLRLHRPDPGLVVEAGPDQALRERGRAAPRDRS